MRGNLIHRLSLPNGIRSIPASAGEPCNLRRQRSTRWVYPRECGGTQTIATGEDVGKGLSPRVRGNHGYPIEQVHEMRSIPASAGEPDSPNIHGLDWRVYPRECGGTLSSFRCQDSQQGLSPRVRGNQITPGMGILMMRSIPASAGEPWIFNPLSHDATVYPRECGGTQVNSGIVGALGGLSPRVRGNHRRRAWLRVRWRSIPASAGEPVNTNSPFSSVKVYPRECGGTAITPHAPFPGYGLSPRVRGNPGKSTQKTTESRSIPASAGEPLWSSRTSRPPPVYPRECGGTLAYTLPG